MSSADAPQEPLARLREFCALLPETAEIDGFGNPTFRVATIPFVIFELEREAEAICFKTTLDIQEQLVRRAGFSAEPLTGEYGWTVVELDGSVPWDEIDLLVISSYRLVAPGELILELDTMLGY
jgi:predicted DNA-binding protein (MmcQ/YjbR family)